jgi:hypothetical protein
MKKTLSFVVLALLASSVAGCGAGAAFFPAGAPMGSIYTGTTSSYLVTSNDVGSKHGEACGMSILGLVTIGDAAVEVAAKAGGITKISIVDNKDFNVLGVYASHCVEVTGN